MWCYTSVSHTRDLSVKFLLNFGNRLSWMAQVHDDEVEAPQPSCYRSWFMIQLNSPVFVVAECWRAVRKFSSPLELARLLALSSTRRELPVNCSSHTPAPCCKHPTYCGSSNNAFHIDWAHDETEALGSS